MQIGSRISPVHRSAFHFVITKGSDAWIRLSAAVNQNHPSRIMLEPKTPVEFSDGDILIETSPSVTNNAYQHVLSAGLAFKMPILRHLKSLSCAWLSTPAKASSFNGWPYILGVPTQAHNTAFKLYGNRPKWEHRYFNIPAATLSIMCKINMPWNKGESLEFKDRRYILELRLQAVYILPSAFKMFLI